MSGSMNDEPQAFRSKWRMAGGLQQGGIGVCSVWIKDLRCLYCKKKIHDFMMYLLTRSFALWYFVGMDSSLEIMSDCAY